MIPDLHTTPEEEPRVSSPPCPFCDGSDTEVISPFGGQLSVSQCWCRRCRAGFDYLKWEEHHGDTTS